MLGATTQLIEQGFPPFDRVNPGIKQAVHNALLESLLVHVRVVDDFPRRNRPSQSDDVVAVMYLPSWTPQTCLTRDERDHLNKRVMHLSTVRGDGPVGWQLDKARQLVTKFTEFLQAFSVEEPSRAQWFRKWMEWDEPAAT